MAGPDAFGHDALRGRSSSWASASWSSPCITSWPTVPRWSARSCDSRRWTNSYEQTTRSRSSTRSPGRSSWPRVLSAIAQGLLAGIGFYLAGLHFVFVLTMLTMLLAMMPFVGAAAVWIPCCLWLYLYDGRMAAAIVLAVYGGAVVSVIDNVIKPMVLHGRSNLHPLLALLSMLGRRPGPGPDRHFRRSDGRHLPLRLLVMAQKEIDVLMGEAAAVASSWWSVAGGQTRLG